MRQLAALAFLASLSALVKATGSTLRLENGNEWVSLSFLLDIPSKATTPARAVGNDIRWEFSCGFQIRGDGSGRIRSLLRQSYVDDGAVPNLVNKAATWPDKRWTSEPQFIPATDKTQPPRKQMWAKTGGQLRYQLAKNNLGNRGYWSHTVDHIGSAYTDAISGTGIFYATTWLDESQWAATFHQNFALEFGIWTQFSNVLDNQWDFPIVYSNVVLTANTDVGVATQCQKLAADIIVELAADPATSKEGAGTLAVGTPTIDGKVCKWAKLALIPVSLRISRDAILAGTWRPAKRSFVNVTDDSSHDRH